MLIIEDLRREHDRIIQLLSEIKETSERPTPELIQGYFDQLEAVFSEHLKKESQSVYVAATSQTKSRDLADAAEAEHQSIKDLVRALAKMSPGQQSWSETMQELKNLVEHHIHSEEKTIFPLAEAFWKRQIVAGDSAHPSSEECR